VIAFLYSVLLKLLYPTSIAVILLLASALLRHRYDRRLSRIGPAVPSSGSPVVPSSCSPVVPSPPRSQLFARLCFWLGLAVLLICGNLWVVEALTRNLEWKQLPPDPVPEAHAIVVLSGGILRHVPPRPTIEVGDAGDRLLYGAHLFRQGRAPHIICTGKRRYRRRCSPSRSL